MAAYRACAVAGPRSSRQIKRIYFYQWRHDADQNWDSAFVSANGKRRPAYYALRAQLRRR